MRPVPLDFFIVVCLLPCCRLAAVQEFWLALILIVSTLSTSAYTIALILKM